MKKRTLIEPSQCTGCSACAAVCQVKAIEMRHNSEGFAYPHIAEEKCLNCGLCKEVCRNANSKPTGTTTPDCFALAAGDELRSGNSSSGAIFPLLASHILHVNGYVCGAAFDDNFVLRHEIVDNEEDTKKLRGSKYLQSSIGNIYSEVEFLLKKGKKILFTGTPCQVSGLKAFLTRGKDRTNQILQDLYTIDIVCHGVPSPHAYRKYLNTLLTHPDERVISVNFRDKVNGWSPYLTTTTTTHNTYSFAASEDTFMRAFLGNYCLRQSCGTCVFSSIPRVANLTLGDFWGIDAHDIDKSLNDHKGTSLLLVNDAKGKLLLEQIKPHCKIYKQTPLQWAVAGNPCLDHPCAHHKHRDMFFTLLEKKPLATALAYASGKTYDAAVMNMWWGDNYGAILTCYALQKTLENLGLIPRIINFPQPNNGPSSKFARHLNLTQECKFTRSDLLKLNQETGTFIIGSDQVFRHRYTWNYGRNIWQLSFAGAKAKKIAYAASFGTDVYEGDHLATLLTKYYLHRFDYISVREDSGVDICRDVFGVNAKHVLDPVFLPEVEVWENLASFGKSISGDYIASYVLDKNTMSEKLVGQAKQYFQMPHMSIEDAQKKYLYSGNTVEDWLCTIKNSSFLITDSFHGMCFAIIFNVPFLVLGNLGRGYSRFASLLKMTNLEHRLVTALDERNAQNALFAPYDYGDHHKLIDVHKKDSLSFLEEALQNKKETFSPDADMHDEIIESLQLQLDRLTDVDKQIRDIAALITYPHLKYEIIKMLNIMTFNKIPKVSSKFKYLNELRQRVKSFSFEK